jgi:hypothetical protein
MRQAHISLATGLECKQPLIDGVTARFVQNRTLRPHDEYSGSICAAFEEKLHDSSHETAQKFGSCRFGYVLKTLVLPLGVRFFTNRAFRPIVYETLQKDQR